MKVLAYAGASTQMGPAQTLEALGRGLCKFCTATALMDGASDKSLCPRDHARLLNDAAVPESGLRQT